MSRKLKYGEPTKTVGFKVPLSKVDDVRKLVEEYLNKIKTFETGDVLVMKDLKPETNFLEKFVKIVMNEGCGCTIENGLLRRAKNSKCKLTKSEH